MTQPLLLPYGAADWAAIMPTAVVAIAALVVLVADLVLPKHLRRPVAIALGIVGLATGGIMALQQWHAPFIAFGGAYINSGFAIAFQEIVIVAGIFSLLMAYALGRDDQVGGAIGLLLWSAAGAMLMAGAANLLHGLSRPRIAVARAVLLVRDLGTRRNRASRR